MVANIFGKLKRGDHVGLALLNCGDNTRNYQMIPTPSGGLLPRALQDPSTGVLQVCGTVNGKPSVLNGEVKHHIPLGSCIACGGKTTIRRIHFQSST